ncbi:hypothetical protein [Deinococcus sp. Leaf326]|uniref:hypothetical protein n=1 Tax=Deinococcus sp. Leaf326 TaxID=1736338 RepID=UPI0006F8D491|nr:hypothetical protein [Deinococcus sp. Leaf326]KQR27948.1 hypothetical protein ASF71_05040 [Deinococcus sp. Leaf326]
MPTLHLLGRVYMTQDDQALSLSHKAAALLAYLSLEGRPHHREHLAELLWNHSGALRNLRVELTRLRQQQLALFPERQPMLALNCDTDLARLVAAAPGLSERQLPAWLAQLRGLPLGDLDDLGSPAFQDWVTRQRLWLCERLEDLLGEVQLRFAQRGQMQAVDQIRERAAQLDLQLPPISAGDAPAARGSHFAFPAQEAELRRVLDRSDRSPQIVYLSGPSGAKRSMIDAAARGSEWKVLHLQVTGDPRLFQATLVQQLAQALPRLSGALLDTLERLQRHQSLDLIRLAQVLMQSDTPLLLSLNLNQAEPWFAGGLHFALNGRCPVTLVLTSGSTDVLEDVRQQLGPVNLERMHRLSLPPVGTAGLLPALAEQATPGSSGPSEDDLYGCAARLSARTEGWPLYLRSLLGSAAGGDPTPSAAQTSEMASARLAELQHLGAPVRRGLSVLAQVHDRFDLAMARELLGPLAEEVMHVGAQQGVLVPAQLEEEVQLPGLLTWVSDAEPHVSFASEITRAALAGRLTPAERQDLRRRLADLAWPTSPALAAHYAERAGLQDLAAQARAALGSPAVSPARLPAPQPATGPLGNAAPRREVRTPGGYRVALEHGRLEVLRRGRPGPTPRLRLNFGEVSAGPWSMTLRLDLYTHLLPGEVTGPYALGLGLGHEPQKVYAPAPLSTPIAAGLDPCLGLLPVGHWVQISGQGGAGRLTLSTRATDLALTIGALSWNGQHFLPER